VIEWLSFLLQTTDHSLTCSRFAPGSVMILATKQEVARLQRRSLSEERCLIEVFLKVNLRNLRMKSFKRRLSSKTCNHPLIDLSGYANVVEVVFANKLELTSLIKIKDLAAFHFGCFARFDAERPGEVV